MKVNAIKGWATALFLILGNSLHASTLEEIYTLAVKNDPQLAAAAATFKSRQQISAQARAGLLPTVTASASATRSSTEIIDLSTSSDNTSQGWQASIRQPLFRAATWFQFLQSKNVTASAMATFAAAQQEVIVRVATTYFGILEAQDGLSAANAAADAVKRQLEQVQQRFDVGLVAITDVLEATAAYDSSVAALIEARGFQAIQFEQLLRLTGEPLTEIVGLTKNFPVAYPEPQDPEAWVQTAMRQNYSIQSAQEDVRSAERQVLIAKSGHLPTVDAQASYSQNDSGAKIANETKTSSMSLVLNVPIYSGGSTSSLVKQASFNLEASQKVLELNQRTVAEQTRSLFSAITTDVGKVRARQKGIESSQSAMDATQTGYEVGTRNIVDVLLAQQRLYAAQFQYAQARYKYVTDTLKIKQVSGTLSPEDIAALDKFLDPAMKVGKLSTLK